MSVQSDDDGEFGPSSSDRIELDRFFRTYLPTLHSYFARRAIGHEEDLVQQTCLEFLRCSPSCSASDAGGFLLGVARNVLLRHHRVETKWRGRATDWQSGDPTPDVLALQAELVAALHRALQRLGERDKAVLDQYYWEEMSSADIAVLAGVNGHTARTWLNRARDRAARHLGEDVRKALD